jgi:hypothetical protein
MLLKVKSALDDVRRSHEQDSACPSRLAREMRGKANERVTNSETLVQHLAPELDPCAIPVNLPRSAAAAPRLRSPAPSTPRSIGSSDDAQRVVRNP